MDNQLPDIDELMKMATNEISTSNNITHHSAEIIDFKVAHKA